MISTGWRISTIMWDIFQGTFDWRQETFCTHLVATSLFKTLPLAAPTQSQQKQDIDEVESQLQKSLERLFSQLSVIFMCFPSETRFCFLKWCATAVNCAQVQRFMSPPPCCNMLGSSSRVYLKAQTWRLGTNMARKFLRFFKDENFEYCLLGGKMSHFKTDSLRLTFFC